MNECMARLTRAENGSAYYVDSSSVSPCENDFAGEAIERLAKFENAIDDLNAKQAEITKQLEALRAEDKTKSVKFKQLLANKMTNQNILILFKSYGIE